MKKKNQIDCFESYETEIFNLISHEKYAQTYLNETDQK